MTLRIRQRQIWDTYNENSLKDQMLLLHENVGHIRSSVLNVSDLPAYENQDGILRLVLKEQALYQWVADEARWVKISQAEKENPLGGGYFREIHHASSEQKVFTILNPQPFQKEKLLVFVDGTLKNINDDYIFLENRIIEFVEPLQEGQKVIFYLPGTIQEIRTKTETVYEYDNFQNIVKATITGDVNRIYEYGYDNKQNIILEKVTDIITGESKTRTYEYDENQNVVRVNDDGVDILYVHRISDVAFDYYNNIANHKVQCIYDEKNRLSVEIYSGDIEKRVSYFYNNNDLVDTKITYEKTKTITELFFYDNEKRMIEKRVSVSYKKEESR
ncbi:MAG: hypothetical protein N2043_02150 [Ignavibacterium sp.]|nr:hypothetical protein [Ignavibacterium sp.]